MRGRRSQDREDLVANLGGAAFVGVEAEDPIVPAFCDGAIAQIAEALEWDLNDARAEALGDLGRAVGAAGIGHDDLVRPQHAGHRIGDLAGFVERNDVGRHFLHVRSLSPTAAQANTAGDAE